MPDKSCMNCTSAEVYGEYDHLLTCPCKNVIVSDIKDATKQARDCSDYKRMENK